MTNLTIVVDKQTLKKARIRALEESTSVNTVLREFSEAYARVRRERWGLVGSHGGEHQRAERHTPRATPLQDAVPL